MKRTPLAGPLPAKQDRSRRTRDALMAAGWTLLERQAWQDISVIQIATEAGVSVGSFYTRFATKEAFFESLSAAWIERRREQRKAFMAGMSPQVDYAAECILWTYRSLMRYSNFWTAALAKGAGSPDFWRPFRESALIMIDNVVDLRSAQLGRSLTADETRHIRFAFQMTNGLINNSIVNRPGPIMLGTPEFESELVRGLKAVAGIA
ncbi:MAG: TetR/AcrR family transcriptional regulator [Pseudomonadota bacterium]